MWAIVNPPHPRYAESMSDEPLPPGILPEDWAATPPSVRALVRTLLATVEAQQRHASRSWKRA
ncbi:MAG: hypothetical protein HY023_05620 [Chloroflexi bacterium]|nr:hypothetical protein [Chloroflexota bacterium]